MPLKSKVLWLLSVQSAFQKDQNQLHHVRITGMDEAADTQDGWYLTGGDVKQGFEFLIF